MTDRKFTITMHGGSGSFTLAEGSRHIERLTWEELLGEIASLTHPRIRESRYPNEWKDKEVKK